MTFGGKEMKVLIVDDEIYMLDYLKSLVDWETYGFSKVLTARGGSMARDLIRDEQPELLITDIKMPKLSGLDLAKFIEKNQYPTKTVIVSGYSEFDYAQQAVRYGVTEYLVKPILKEDFEETLKRVVEKYFRQEQNSSDEQNMEKQGAVSWIRQFISENYNTNLSLETLGELVHLHPAYLSRVFKEETGKNLSAYITDVRMEKAAELLQTDLRVHEVMERVGYQKSQYFSKLFREKFGVTPKEYRKIAAAQSREQSQKR